MALWGYFLKLVLADNLAMYVNAVYNNVVHHSGSSLVLASFLFSFQIYGDFAGYSLIAIGVAKVMGFELMTNFNRPYFAQNIGSFWSRWHISLSTWFKDYVYIPLGGNRVSKVRNLFNLFFTFFVSGIWHGANFTFMVWGALHGMFLMIEKYFGIGKTKKVSISINVLFRILITFLSVTFAWIFFRANSIGESWVIVYKIITSIDAKLFINYEVFFVGVIGLCILFIKESMDEFTGQHYSLLNNRNLIVRLISYACLFAIILLFGVFDNSQFIYFQF